MDSVEEAFNLLSNRTCKNCEYSYLDDFQIEIDYKGFKFLQPRASNLISKRFCSKNFLNSYYTEKKDSVEVNDNNTCSGWRQKIF